MYNEFYNLKSSPFENTPDPLFLYMSKQHREVLSALWYGVNSAKGLILVTGEVGTGKTTLVHALLNSIRHPHLVIHVFNPRIRFSDILLQLAKKLSIAVKGLNTIELIRLIHRKLKQLDANGKSAVLLIDEAHLLSEKSLDGVRLLLNFETDKRKLIQVILVGQNEIYCQLQKHSLRSLRQRIVINRRLKPLDQEETQKYIQHRLSIAGNNDTVFDHQAISRIWEGSHGFPRLVNQICDNALLIGFAEEKKTIGKRIIKEAVRDMEEGHQPQPKKRLQRRPPRYLKIACAVATGLAMLAGGMFLLQPTTDDRERIPERAAMETALESLSDNTIQKPLEDFATGDKDKASFMEILKHVYEITSAERSDLRSTDHLKVDDSGKDAVLDHGHRTGVVQDKIPTPTITVDPSKLAFGTMGKPVNMKLLGGNKLPATLKQVRPKDNLYQIVRQEYGFANDSILDLVQMANPHLAGVHSILPGQNISLPLIKKESLIVQSSEGTFHIYGGAHREFHNALEEVERMHARREKAFIHPAVQSDNIVYRIYYGVFLNRRHAEIALNGMNFNNLPCLNEQASSTHTDNAMTQPIKRDKWSDIK